MNTASAVLQEALPEFLGSLGSSIVLATSIWLFQRGRAVHARRRHRQASGPTQPIP